MVNGLSANVIHVESDDFHLPHTGKIIQTVVARSEQLGNYYSFTIRC